MGKIFFHHIPKTGGTSLIYAVQRLFGDAVCPARYDYQLDDEMLVSSRYAFYHGHFTRHAVLRFRAAHPDGFVFTLLRHPFSRTLSQYYNWINRDKVRHEFAAIANSTAESDHTRALRAKFEGQIFDMSLSDFLSSEDPDIRQVVTNLQAQYLTDVESPNYLRFNKAALNAISSYNFIGLCELYGESVGIIEAKCHLPAGSLADTPRENVGDGRVDGQYRVSPGELALLEACNAYDLILFHLAYTLLLRGYGDRLPAHAGDIDLLAGLPAVVG